MKSAQILGRTPLMAIAGLALAGCVSGEAVQVKQVAEKAAVPIPIGSELAPIKFSNAIFKIKRGTTIGDY
jgi:hypothetical protein